MFRFIDRPIYCERDWYQEALERISNTLIREQGVKAIYKFGNITVPGISDLDLLVVFDREAHSTRNGFESLEEQHKRLFTHGIMALREDHFRQNMFYTIWSDPVLIQGTETPAPPQTRNNAEDEAVKQQTGLEFLLAHYIDMAVQLKYRIFKVRALLQHTKGLPMDLAFLGIHDSPIHLLCQELRERTLHWFENDNPDDFLNDWIIRFTEVYFSLCRDIFHSRTMYLPGGKTFAIAKNMQLRKSNELNHSHYGLVFPNPGLMDDKKHFKLLNKANRFRFNVPLTDQPAHPILAQRFNFLREMKAHNRQHLPNFMTITTSITSKII